MSTIRDNLRRNLSYYLWLKGLSQKELAKSLNVTQAAVTNWVKGKNSPDIEVVAKICQVLDISVIDLFGIESNCEYTQKERRLIEQYRKRPELQLAIDILLDLDQTPT